MRCVQQPKPFTSWAHPMSCLRTGQRGGWGTGLSNFMEEHQGWDQLNIRTMLFSRAGFMNEKACVLSPTA